MTTSDIVLDLYASASEASRWPQALDRLCQQIGVRSAVIQRFRKSAHSIDQLWAARDSFSTSNAALHDRFVNNADNPRYDVRLTKPQMCNRIIRDEERFATVSQDRIDRFRQRLARARLGNSMGAVHPVSGDEAIAVIVHRDADDQRGFSIRDEAVLLELLPHIGQASELTWRFLKSSAQASQIQSIAERLLVGIVQLGTDNRIEWANKAARDAIFQSSNLFLAGDFLRGRTAQDRRLLATVLQTGEQSTDIAVFGAGEQHELQLMRLDGATDFEHPVLLVSAPRMMPAAPVEAIAQILGVTVAEARVSGAVLAGSTLKAYARSRGVSEGSARNQLKQVFAKTGLKRQSELVGYLANSVTSHVAPGDPRQRKPS